MEAEELLWASSQHTAPAAQLSMSKEPFVTGDPGINNSRGGHVEGDRKQSC